MVNFVSDLDNHLWVEINKTAVSLWSVVWEKDISETVKQGTAPPCMWIYQENSWKYCNWLESSATTIRNHNSVENTEYCQSVLLSLGFIWCTDAVCIQVSYKIWGVVGFFVVSIQ